MDDRIVLALEQLTQGLIERLKEAAYEELAALVEEREKLIDQIRQSPPSAEQKANYQARIQRILSLDPIIMQRMTELKKEAADQLAKFNNAKMQRDMYGAAPDYNPSLFFDSRK